MLLTEPVLEYFLKKYQTLFNSKRIENICPFCNKSGVTNYRPISLLSILSKALEKIVYQKILQSISSKISNSRFGFCEKRLCLTQLLTFLDLLTKRLALLLFKRTSERLSTLCPIMNSNTKSVYLASQVLHGSG